MENIENIIPEIVNEDTVDIAVEAVEAIPVKSINWGKVGKRFGICAGAFVIGVCASKIYTHVKRKNQLKAAQEQAAATGVDNVQVAKDDFEEPVEVEAEEK